MWKAQTTRYTLFSSRTCMMKVLFFALLFFLLFGVEGRNASIEVIQSSPCLPRLVTDRAHFQSCLTSVCFLFLNQIPFVINDPIMTGLEHQSLFPCKNRKKLFPKLGGVPFKIHQEIDFEAQCAWAGSNCTFNEMSQLVIDIAKDPSTKNYKFGVQGMIAQLPTRITSTLHTTVTIAQDPIIILRSNQDSGSAASTSFNQVFRGFENSTWMSIGVILLILLSLALLLSFAFNGTIAPMEVILTMTSEPAIPDEDDVATKNHQKRRCTIALLGLASSAFAIITILFYEISIVNFIFNSREEKLEKPLNEFSDKELALFCLRPKTSPENTVIKSVDPDGTRFPNKEFPWFSCATWDACYRKILDPKDPMKYMAVFRPEALYEIKKREACGKVTILDMSGDSSSFSGGKGTPHGWYLSTSVPEPLFVKLNQELLKIKLDGDLDTIMEQISGSENTCANESLAISPPVTIIPLTLIMRPPLLLIIFILLHKAFISNKHVTIKKQREEGVLNIERLQEEERNTDSKEEVI